MQSVFSHIVKKRLSQENENVATEALAFILQSSKAAQVGMAKLLRSVVPDLPNLWFRTQQTEGDTRPDLWGLDEKGAVHVFVENKFWAGLTDCQPVSYLRRLAERPHPSLLLVVVPAAREKAVWRELINRLRAAEFPSEILPACSGASLIARTRLGPVLALTNWTTLLAFLEAETAEDLQARNDISQVRALCEEADNSAFFPFTREEMSEQRIPALMLQLTGLVEAASALAFEDGVLFRDRLKPQANEGRIGRYASILSEQRCGGWLGIHLGLWKEHGQSPFWVLFSASDWGRAGEVRAILEPWAAQTGVFVATQPNGDFVVAIEIWCGQEKVAVVRAIVDQLGALGKVLEPLSRRATPTVPDAKEE